MSEATPPAPAPAAPAPAPAAPSPAPAPADPGADSLLRAPPAPAPAPGAPAPAAPDFEFAEKVRIFKPDGGLDEVATGRKSELARRALEKRLGVGDTRPEKADAYAYTPPDTLKALLDDKRTGEMKTRAHELGLTQAQFEGVVSDYLKGLPELVNGAAAVGRQQAEATLRGTWKTDGDFTAGLGAAALATSKLPADLQAELHTLGTQPAVVRALAHFGALMREDGPPADTGGVPAGFDPNDPAVMAIAKDSKHPKHAEVVKARAAYFEARAKAPK